MTQAQKSIGLHRAITTTSPGAYSRYVGRVGALAAATGVGVALTLMPGMAWASPDGDAASPSSSDSSGTDGNNAGETERETGEGDGDANISDADENEADDAEANGVTSSATNTGVTGDDVGEGEVVASNTSVALDSAIGVGLDGSSTTGPGVVIDTTPVDATTTTPVYAATPLAVEPPSVTDDSAPVGAMRSPDPVPRGGLDSPASFDQSSTAEAHLLMAAPLTIEEASGDVARLMPTGKEVDFDDGLGAPDLFAESQRIAVATSAESEVAPATTSSLMSGLVGLVLSPFLAVSPAGPPVAAPALFAVLAFVRREFERTFFNGTPIADPEQPSTPASGVVTGTVVASDPDDDRLTYTVVSGPATPGATVVVDPDDGSYTYTPTAAQTVTGDSDSFTVAVTDSPAGLHFHGIPGLISAVVRVATLGLIDLPDGHTTFVTVPVTVAPVVTPTNRPPVAAVDAYPVDEDQTLNVPAVQGVLANDTDPDVGDSLSAQLVDGPVNGALTLNEDGSFTYTPDANYSGTDSFTYQAVDSSGATSGVTTVTLTVVDVAEPPGDTIAVGEGVTGVAVSPDGSRVYVVNQGDNLSPGTVSVIDTATNTVIDTDGDPTNGVTPITVGTGPSAVAVHPDGTRAYVTNQVDGTLSVIDTATDTLVDTDDDPTNGVTPITVGFVPSGVAVSPDGTRAYVTNQGDGTVSVIDTATNTVIDTDGDASNGNTPISVGSAPLGVAVSPNGAHVYVANSLESGTVSVIDTATNTVVDTDGDTANGITPIPVGSYPGSVAVSPDGTRAYVTNLNDSTVTVIDTTTNTVVDTDGDPSNGTTPIDVGSGPYNVAVTPDGTLAYVTNYNDGTVSVIDTATNMVVDTDDDSSNGDTSLAVGNYPVGVAFSPDGTRAYVTNQGDSTVSVIDTGLPPLPDNRPPIAAVDTYEVDEDQTLNVTAAQGVLDNDFDPDFGGPLSAQLVDGPANGALTLNEDGSFTYTPDANYSGTDSFTYQAVDSSGATSGVTTVNLTVVDVAEPIDDPEVIDTIAGFSSPAGAAVSPDGTRVYVSNSSGNTVTVIDTATNTVVDTDGDPGNGVTDLVVGSNPGAIVLSPDGTRAYVVTGAAVSVIDTTTNTVVDTDGDPSNGVTGIAVDSGGLLETAISPDGTRLYIVDQGFRTVSVIDTTTNTVVDTDGDPSNGVTGIEPVPIGTPEGVAVSPDGTRVYVTIVDQGIVSVIDTATNTVVDTDGDPSNGTTHIAVGPNPFRVALSPDGSRAYVSNAGDSTVAVIDTVTNTVVDTDGDPSNGITSVQTGGTMPYAVAVSPDGTHVYVTDYVDGTVTVFDTATNTVVDTDSDPSNGVTPLAVGNTPLAITISADGARAYVTNANDGTVSVIDTGLASAPSDAAVVV